MLTLDDLAPFGSAFGSALRTAMARLAMGVFPWLAAGPVDANSTLTSAVTSMAPMAPIAHSPARATATSQSRLAGPDFALFETLPDTLAIKPSAPPTLPPSGSPDTASREALDGASASQTAHAGNAGNAGNFGEAARRGAEGKEAKDANMEASWPPVPRVAGSITYRYIFASGALVHLRSLERLETGPLPWWAMN